MNCLVNIRSVQASPDGQFSIGVNSSSDQARTTRNGSREEIHMTPPVEVPPLFKPSLVEKVAADLSLKLVLDAQAAAAVFTEETIGRLADACWFSAEGDVVQGINNRARYTDLVILGWIATAVMGAVAIRMFIPG